MKEEVIDMYLNAGFTPLQVAVFAKIENDKMIAEDKKESQNEEVADKQKDDRKSQYEAIQAEIKRLTEAVQTNNIAVSQQKNEEQTVEQILAEIIAPRKDNK